MPISSADLQSLSKTSLDNRLYIRDIVAGTAVMAQRGACVFAGRFDSGSDGFDGFAVVGQTMLAFPMKVMPDVTSVLKRVWCRPAANIGNISPAGFAGDPV